MMGPSRGPTDVLCVACQQPMHLHSLGEQGLWVHVCPGCYGTWLAAGQLEAIKQSHVAEILDKKTSWKTWLFQFLLALPVEFNLKPKAFAWVTFSLLALNTLAFAALLLGPTETLVLGYALYPALVGEQQWWVSLFSHQFLHGGFLHIGMNLYFLYILGDNVEDALGHVGFITFYLLCGVAGGVAHTLIDGGSTTPMLGASGAISGVMAAYAVFFRRAKLTFMLVVFQFKLSAMAYVGVWLALNVAGLLMGGQGVAWGAHLGGFGLGLVLALALDGVVLTHRPLVRLLRNHRRAL
ncbi:MAG: rhomboid family intramembrane serine protease [Deltaproteobacteria bacterium]|nr:rhomboid family intramembrane serine protease [Deltaproteobacteria bacterium]